MSRLSDVSSSTYGQQTYDSNQFQNSEIDPDTDVEEAGAAPAQRFMAGLAGGESSLGPSVPRVEVSDRKDFRKATPKWYPGYGYRTDAMDPERFDTDPVPDADLNHIPNSQFVDDRDRPLRDLRPCDLSGKEMGTGMTVSERLLCELYRVSL